MSEILIKINNVDKTDYVIPKSLKIRNILTKQTDTCSLIIRNYGAKIYSPDNEDELEIWNGSDKIFGGIITKIQQRMPSLKIVEYDISAIDYTRLADRKLIHESYSDKTINYIINDLNTNYLSGFTISNVNCDIEIDYITFNYETFSKCLEELADYTGYDWYIDYDKDIHFFSKERELSPFNLTDTNNNYILKSLRVKEDLSQLKNIVYVRGTRYLEEKWTEYQIGNGITEIFNIAYESPFPLSDISVKVNAVAQTVGIDWKDSPDDYDCLCNFNEKIIKFKNATIPANGVQVEISFLCFWEWELYVLHYIYFLHGIIQI